MSKVNILTIPAGVIGGSTSDMVWLEDISPFLAELVAGIEGKSVGYTSFTLTPTDGDEWELTAHVANRESFPVGLKVVSVESKEQS